MAEVLFGQSYYLRFDPKLWEAMQPYPPLGTLYAAAYVRERGYDVALFDAMLADSEERWAEALDRHQPRFAVLYEDNFNYLSKMCLLRMREAAITMTRMAKERGCTVILCGADATDHALFAACLAQGARAIRRQRGADLGERMYHALAAGLARYERVLLVGSDCPAIDAAYLHRALQVLDDVPVVLGPALDGGYVLIGVRSVDPALFAGIAWGQPTVYAETVARLRRLGVDWTALPALPDIDRPADLVHWRGPAAGGPVPGLRR